MPRIYQLGQDTKNKTLHFLKAIAKMTSGLAEWQRKALNQWVGKTSSLACFPCDNIVLNGAEIAPSLDKCQNVDGLKYLRWSSCTVSVKMWKTLTENQGWNSQQLPLTYHWPIWKTSKNVFFSKLPLIKLLRMNLKVHPYRSWRYRKSSLVISLRTALSV